jgi:hypothetical protein
MHMRRSPTPSFVSWGRPLVLSVLTALVAAVVVCAAVPDKAKAKPADAPQSPLFQVVEIKPENMAVLTIGTEFAPRSGPWCGFSALIAGAHPEVQAWNLRGPLSTRPSRIQLGASTLFLNGFGPSAALRDLATLQVGDDMNCWNLINTDEVRPISKALLENGFIRDKHGIFNGDLEIEAYARFIVMAHFTSAKAFTKAARHDVTFAHLFNDPERYRGDPVHITGRLVRLHRFDPPDEARAEGVSDLYEGWIFTDAYGENPVCVVFTDLPSGLKITGERNLHIDDVGFDGYFYKRYRYKAYDTKKKDLFRDAPLLIGHTLTGKFGPEAGEEGVSDNWGHSLIWVFGSVVGGALVAILVLTGWYRYHDRRVRHRLRAARDTGFVPPPDEMFAEPDDTTPNGTDAGPPPFPEAGRGPRWSDFPQAPN